MSETSPIVLTAADTRDAYRALIDAVRSVKFGFGAGPARKKARDQFNHDGINAINAVANHASHTSGAKEVTADIDAFTAERDVQMSTFMKNALITGKRRGAEARAARAAEAKERANARGAERGWMSELTAVPGLAYTESVAHFAPRILEIWNADDNNGIEPHQVRKQANSGMRWRCREGHVSPYQRVNNIANVLNKGGHPVCVTCQPHRQAALVRIQDDLGSLVAAISNPDAFNALSPAVQFSVLSHLGLTGSGRESLQRSIAMSIVHGDLTLKEVVKAKDVTKIDGKIREVGDEDADLGTVADLSGSTAVVAGSDATIAHALGAVGVIDLIDRTTELGENLADDIIREGVENLWKAAVAEGGSEVFMARVSRAATKSESARLVVETFKSQFAAVQAAGLPDTYVVERPTGVKVPTLDQRRFAQMIVERRRYLNLSEPGAGKTLAATLAVLAADAREVLVVCPKPVIGQWVAEFRQGHSDVEVKVGLPKGEPGDRSTHARVWVTNYESFQGDVKKVEARSGLLVGLLDAIVFDEIHMAKASETAAVSKRHKALVKFTDACADVREDIVVIGASATPVINDLSEALAVLRLVEGPATRRFPTSPTIRNSAIAHRRLAASGMRLRPKYGVTLNREDVVVDVTDRLASIAANADRLMREREVKRMNPAIMEQALIIEKIPSIVERVKGTRGPSIVFSMYTTDMVEPIIAAMGEAGLRAAPFTGVESESERDEALAAFKAGDLDVIVGSSPIGTGVDGLQEVCNHMVVASMSWTAAADDQLVGRLFRQGQTSDVTVDYVLTEAKVGDVTWSWCRDNRQSRVAFKRSIADAAVDGIMPDGVLEDESGAASASLEALRALVAV